MTRDYTPFGETLVASGNDNNAFQYSQKELDSGIGLYYFGARYYNPAIGRWLVPDPAGQGFSPYVYCGNSPLMYTDPDGEFIFAICKYLYYGFKDGDWKGDNWKDFLNNMSFSLYSNLIDPGVAMCQFSILGGINNIIHNWPGIQKSNFLEAMGKIGVSLASGVTVGGVDWYNGYTAGVLKTPLGQISGEAISISHNVAFDKPVFDPMSRKTATNMLTRMYGHGASGTEVKVGGDLTYSRYILSENSQGPSRSSKYLSAKDRFDYMHWKMNFMDYYAKSIYGTNYLHPDDVWYHETGSKIWGPNLWYWQFEVWGENYVQWEQDDYEIAFGQPWPFPW